MAALVVSPSTPLVCLHGRWGHKKRPAVAGQLPALDLGGGRGPRRSGTELIDDRGGLGLGSCPGLRDLDRLQHAADLADLARHMAEDIAGETRDAFDLAGCANGRLPPLDVQVSV
jgi:hypothetical protein